jgi:hypothetical protein
MNVEHIKSALLKAPVKPVEIELDNGRKFKLRHPDFVFFNAKENAMIITEDGSFEVIDVDHVTSVSRKTK